MHLVLHRQGQRRVREVGFLEVRWALHRRLSQLFSDCIGSLWIEGAATVDSREEDRAHRCLEHHARLWFAGWNFGTRHCVVARSQSQFDPSYGPNGTRKAGHCLI